MMIRQLLVNRYNVLVSEDPDMLELTPGLVVSAYAQGAFPMAQSRDDARIGWYSPDPRAVLPLDGFHCSRSLMRLMSRGEHEIRFDTAFEQVIDGCAAPRDSQHESWINTEIRRVFVELHTLGLAHSIEVWREERLIGGLYGLAMGGAFFGESMFHPASTPGAMNCPRRWTGVDVSKIALAATVDHLRVCGYRLFDVQFQSEHLRRLGVVEISRDEYLVKLDEALRCDADPRTPGIGIGLQWRTGDCE